MEACVVMLIISIFIAVTANVIPHKIKPKNQSDAHGRYECYYIGNSLYERVCLKGNCKAPHTVDACRFTPPKYIKFLIINAVGGSAANGGSAGQFVSTFYSSSNSNYEVSPGTFGAEAGSKGNDSSVYICNNQECSSKSIVLTAKGGEYTSGINGYQNTTTDNIRSCKIEVGPKISSNNALSKGYTCSKGPACEVESGRIKVSYCRTNELYKTVYLPYSAATTPNAGNYKTTQFIVDSPYPCTTGGGASCNSAGEVKWDSTTGKLLYYDTSLWDDYGTKIKSGWDPTNDDLTPSLYKLTLTLKVNTSTDRSMMDDYVKMLQLPTTEGIRSASPGSIEGTTPHSGAILFLW